MSEFYRTTSTFEPVTVDNMPEDATTLEALKRLMSNPVEIWSDKMYREFFFEGRFLNQRIVHTSDPQTFQDILLTHQSIFPKSKFERRVLEGATGEGLLTAEGAHWKRQRRSAAPAFRHDKLTTLVPFMTTAGAKAGAELAKRNGSVDVLPLTVSATFDIIVETLLAGGDQSLDKPRIAADITTFLEQLGRIDAFDILGLPRSVWRPWTRDGQAAVRRLRQDAAAAIERQRERDNIDGLAALLIQSEDPETGEKLTDTELRDNIITFIGAGHETTSLALAWTLYLLANAPDWQEQLVAERESVCGDAPVCADHLNDLILHRMVIDEAMRLYPPAPAMDRVALDDVELTNLSLKKGDQVVLAIYPMHRHGKLWERPNAFDPTRFSDENRKRQHRFQYVPFSGGPRICIGLRFAQMEAVAILAEILRRVVVSPDPDHTPYPRSRITLRPDGGMLLNVRPR